jgi:hypothetical protein
MANKSTDLTINERRAMKGYEPIAGGDVIEQPKAPSMSPELVKAIAYGSG